jgi:secreted PhoX family phosphatase
MQSRRDFVKFMGRTGLLAATVAPFISVAGTSAMDVLLNAETGQIPFKPLAPSYADDLLLVEGMEYSVVLSWGDKLNGKDTFGFNNDYIAMFPIKGDKHDCVMWVNHEYTNSRFVSKYTSKQTEPKTLAQVNEELYSVGGSLVRVKYDKKKGKWEYVANDPLNRRLTGLTEIPFAWNEPIAGHTKAVGTNSNCAGGITPWGTLLTCEENYDDCWGEMDQEGKMTDKKTAWGWDAYYSHSPWHYGWVVEVEPFTGKAKKLVALGRIAHEAATTQALPDGRCVVYTGDDHNDECLYKFISDKPNSLETGTLYVANMEKGEWVSLDYSKQEILQKHFKSQTEVLIHTRKAAELVGGTKLDRPEDIEIDPLTGNVFVACTNNTPKGNYHGSILKIVETNGRDGLTFKHEVFLAGGKEMGFACPDNMEFDKKGNLWFTSDMSGKAISGDENYKGFGNNSLFYVPFSGPDAGKVVRVVSGPVDSELTGPKFSPDYKTLFVCVQHPGEYSTEEKLSSHWPLGGDNIPKPSVIAISGPSLDKLMK